MALIVSSEPPADKVGQYPRSQRCDNADVDAGEDGDSSAASIVNPDPLTSDEEPGERGHFAVDDMVGCIRQGPSGHKEGRPTLTADCGQEML